MVQTQSLTLRACLKSLAAKLAPAILWMLWIASLATAADEQPITYEDHVVGVMKKHCTTCHGDGKQEAGLSLVSYSGLMKGAGGGEIVIAGRSGGSRLIEVITAPDDGERMPPEGEPLVLASSRSGRLLLAASRCKAAQSCSSTSRPKKRLASVADEPDSIIAADISPDEKYLATGDRIGKIHLWDEKTGGVFDGRFGPQGELATCGRDGLVTLWSPEGKELEKFTVADTTPADKKPPAGVSLLPIPRLTPRGFMGRVYTSPNTSRERKRRDSSLITRPHCIPRPTAFTPYPS